MAKTIVGLFDEAREAEAAVAALKAAGFDEDDVSIVASKEARALIHNSATAGDVQPEAGRASGGQRDSTWSNAAGPNTAAPSNSGISLPAEDPRSDGDDLNEDMGKAGGIGAMVGGAAGLLACLAGFAIPGLGFLLVAGPFAAALTGTGVGAAAGTILGALRHHGVGDDDAHFYAEGVRRGGILVTVRADDVEYARAEEILDRHGAVDLDERTAQLREAGFTNFQDDAPAYTAADYARDRERQRAGGGAASGRRTRVY